MLLFGRLWGQSLIMFNCKFDSGVPNLDDPTQGTLLRADIGQIPTSAALEAEEDLLTDPNPQKDESPRKIFTGEMKRGLPRIPTSSSRSDADHA